MRVVGFLVLIKTAPRDKYACDKCVCTYECVIVFVLFGCFFLLFFSQMNLPPCVHN